MTVETPAPKPVPRVWFHPALGSKAGHSSYEWWMPIVLTYLRISQGISQPKIGPRTYISRLENQPMCPETYNLPRIADALITPLPKILKMCEFLMTGTK